MEKLLTLSSQRPKLYTQHSVTAYTGKEAQRVDTCVTDSPCCTPKTQPCTSTTGARSSCGDDAESISWEGACFSDLRCSPSPNVLLRTLVRWEDRRPGTLVCIRSASLGQFIHSFTHTNPCWMPGDVPASEETAMHKAGLKSDPYSRGAHWQAVNSDN